MEGMEYLYELFEGMPRCGPGDDIHTRRAFGALNGAPERPLILDIGCGTGAQTLALAGVSKGSITALDNYQGFLDILMKRAKSAGVADRVTTKNMSMLDMDFADGSFDIVWSEGALYFMGFQNGLKRCRRLLKDKGYMAVTELVYLTPDRPAEIARYLEGEYPDIKDVPSRIAQIEKADLELVSNFTLPESAWLDNYYLPMEKELDRLAGKYKGNKTALAVFDRFREEIGFYRRYSKHYGYEFFIMRK